MAEVRPAYHPEPTDHSPFFAMLGRMMRAAGRRAAHADAADLAQLVAIRADLDRAIIDAVRGLRRQQITWATIGEATGTTRQAAIQKWARYIDGD